MADKLVSPENFLVFVLSNPMKPENVRTVSLLWATWFKQWLEEQHCYGIEVVLDSTDPAKIQATFRVQGMPNSDSLITVPVEDSPYEIHVVSKVRTGCGLQEPAAPEAG